MAVVNCVVINRVWILFISIIRLLFSFFFHFCILQNQTGCSLQTHAPTCTYRLMELTLVRHSVVFSSFGVAHSHVRYIFAYFLFLVLGTSWVSHYFGENMADLSKTCSEYFSFQYCIHSSEGTIENVRIRSFEWNRGSWGGRGEMGEPRRKIIGPPQAIWYSSASPPLLM